MGGEIGFGRTGVLRRSYQDFSAFLEIKCEGTSLYFPFLRGSVVLGTYDGGSHDILWEGYSSM